MSNTVHEWFRSLHRRLDQRPLLRDRLRRGAIVLLVVYASYLLLANILLNTPLGPKLVNRKPERFDVHWAWAVSPYPGQIHAHDVVLRGKVKKIEWTAHADSAKGHIRLLALMRRRVSFGVITARGVGGALRTADKLMPAAPNNGKPPWGVEIERVDASDLRGFDIGPYRLEGVGQASISLAKTFRKGPLVMAPSRVQMHDVSVRSGKALLLHDGSLDVGFSVTSPKDRAPRGIEWLAAIQAAVKLKAAAPGVELVELADSQMTVRPGKRAGTLDLDLALRQGKLVPGGRGHWSLPIRLDNATSPARDYVLQANVQVPKEGGLEIKATIPRKAGHDEHLDAALKLALAGMQPAELQAQLKRPALQPLLHRLSGTVDMQWLFPTLRWLNPMLSEARWLRFDGNANVRADLRIDKGKLLPGSNADITRAHVQANIFDTVFSGEAHANARIEEKGSRMALSLDRFELTAKGKDAPAYVDGRNLSISLQSSGDISTFREELKAQLHFKDASLPDLRAYNRYLPQKSVRILGGSGTVSADINVDSGGVIETSRVQMRGRDAVIRFGVSTIKGGLNLDTDVHRAPGSNDQYRVQRFVVGLKDVRVDGDTEVAPWWATLSLDGGSVYWRQPYRLEGSMHLAMKDASAMFALFEHQRNLPKWIGKVVDQGAINATGVVSVSEDTVVLDRIRANNERFDLQSRIRVAGGVPHADLYASWGVLGMAIEQRGKKREVHVVKARQWYESQPNLLKTTAGK